MNEVRVIALAGLFQAIALVRETATQGRIDDEAAFNASIESLLRIDADSPAAVFGGLDGIRLGLRTLIVQLDSPERDLDLTRMMIAILQLQRRLERRTDMLNRIRDGVISLERQVEHFGATHPTVLARLAEIYSDTLSHLRPRIVVHGNPLYLSQTGMVNQIRATLLAAIRSAVLWRQMGGRQWRLIVHRREYSMIARGLLTRSTLDAG